MLLLSNDTKYKKSKVKKERKDRNEKKWNLWYKVNKSNVESLYEEKKDKKKTSHVKINQTICRWTDKSINKLKIKDTPSTRFL